MQYVSSSAQHGTDPSMHSQVLWMAFLRWYYIGATRSIVRGYSAYAHAASSFFSVTFLLRTLVSPWKSIRDAYPRSRLMLGTAMQTLTLNLTARGVGMVIRLCALVAALCVQCVLLLCVIALLLLWMLLPALLIAGPFLPLLWYV